MCVICGAPPLPDPYYDMGDWKVVRCSSCTYAWVVDVQPDTSAFSWSDDIVDESGLRGGMYEARLRRVEKLSPSPKSWLDVGCGGGGMLTCAQRAGYAVEGIELSPAGDVIESRYGIPMHRKPLADVMGELKQAQYGVISYFHVLEHVWNPVEELNTARQRLGEGSVLVVEVPFFDSLPWRISGHRHRHFARGHRSYFNRKSLAALLAATGFTPISMTTVAYWMSFGWLLERLGHQGKWGAPFRPLHRILPNGLRRLPFPLYIGDVMFVLARPADRRA